MTRSEYVEKIGKIIDDIKLLGHQYYEIAHRPLGIAGEVAEYDAIRLLELDPADVRQAGYDAIKKILDELGNEKVIKYQVKGRTIQPNSKRSQPLGSINIKKDWDYVLLVIMDEKFNPTMIYQAERGSIIEALTLPGSVARNVRGQLGFSKFKSIGELVWSKELLSN